MLDLSNNAISLAGEFAVLSQLALRGFDANMTLGNTKNVDILVADPQTDHMFKIEVKTHYRENPYHSSLFGHTLDWVMSEKHETIFDPKLFYVFVNIKSETNIFRFFIVPSRIVALYVAEQHVYWMKNKKNPATASDITMRRFRIGLDNSSYAINTPLAKDYENNWNFTSLSLSTQPK